MFNKKIIYLLFFLCIIIASALRLFTLFHTHHLDFESVFRITESYQYSKISPWYHFWHLGIISGGTGGQRGYYLLNSLLMAIINQPDMVARFSSMVFAVLSIIFYFPLLRLLFTREISLASTFALAFYHVHIQLSVVPMANAGFIFFTIISLYCLLRLCFFNSTANSRFLLFLTALFTLLATSFRLEAWLLVIAYPIILLVKKKPLAAVILFILSSLYIVNTLYLMQKCFGNPFIFLQNPLLHIHGAKTSMGFFAHPDNLPSYSSFQGLIWIDTLRYSLSTPLLILGAIGMFGIRSHKKQAAFFFVFFCFLFMLTLRQIISNHSPFIRYVSILAVFFIPFILQGARDCGSLILNCLKLKITWRRPVLMSGIFASLIFFVFVSSSHLVNDFYAMQYQDSVYILDNWMLKNSKSGDLLFSSFNDLDTHAAAIANKYVVSKPLDERIFMSSLYNFLYSRENAIDLSKQAPFLPKSIQDSFFPMFDNRNIFLNLIRSREYKQQISRIVFLFKPADFKYLKAHLPKLLKKVSFSYNGFMYCGILPAY
ncbi:MAG: glycosyltransferase family 39 protein [Candidatus Omnitrophota bacterium]